MPVPVPRVPTTNARHRWRALALALAMLPAGLGLTGPWPAARAQPLPALGDAAAEDLPVGAERRLGERIMREIRRDPDVIDDPLLQDYLDGLWQPLLSAARARGEMPDDQREHFAWQTFLVRDRSVNAFALPGGYVGVHLGLIGLTGTRDELAAVLAHELSHVTQRHIARSIASQRRQSMLGLATMILGVMAASRSPDAANAMIVGGQAAAAQGQLNFSRDMEREADRVGFGVLDGAGYRASGMAGMFDRLQQSSRLNDGGQFPYLRTHPLTSERIAEAQARVESAPIRMGDGDGGAWLHAAMQGRARGMMDGRAEALARLAAAGTAAASAATPAALTAACAGAVASSRLKDWRAADQALERARRLAAGRGEGVARAVQALQVESLLDRGQPAEAAKALGGAGLDGSRAGMMLAARVAAVRGSDAGLASRVREDLQTWVSLRADDAPAWTALALVSERLGQPLAALRAHAEARLAVGDLAGAVDRLRAGQRLARDTRAVETMDAVVIESRLKVVEQRRRVELEQERSGRRDEF